MNIGGAINSATYPENQMLNILAATSPAFLGLGVIGFSAGTVHLMSIWCKKLIAQMRRRHVGESKSCERCMRLLWRLDEFSEKFLREAYAEMLLEHQRAVRFQPTRILTMAKSALKKG